MKIRGFITHKQAEHYTDCQDYFSIDVGKKRIAVSDGMTQSIFSAQWAKILVGAYAHDEWDGQHNLPILQGKWLDYAHGELARQEGKGLPTWMLENTLAMRQGAGATLCGVSFEGFSWKSFVLGDTSIVEIGVDNDIKNIYKSKDGNYDNHPDYYDSFGDIVGNPIFPNGILEESQKLLIVSDPFAELLYNKRDDENVAESVNELLSISSHEEFVSLVDNWRASKGMHNDDSTLIVVECDGEEHFDIDSTPMKTLDQLIEEESNYREDSR